MAVEEGGEGDLVAEIRVSRPRGSPAAAWGGAGRGRERPRAFTSTRAAPVRPRASDAPLRRPRPPPPPLPGAGTSCVLLLVLEVGSVIEAGVGPASSGASASEISRKRTSARSAARVASSPSMWRRGGAPDGGEARARAAPTHRRREPPAPPPRRACCVGRRRWSGATNPCRLHEQPRESRMSPETGWEKAAPRSAARLATEQKPSTASRGTAPPMTPVQARSPCRSRRPASARAFALRRRGRSRESWNPKALPSRSGTHPAPHAGARSRRGWASAWPGGQWRRGNRGPRSSTAAAAAAPATAAAPAAPSPAAARGAAARPGGALAAARRDGSRHRYEGRGEPREQRVRQDVGTSHRHRQGDVPRIPASPGHHVRLQRGVAPLSQGGSAA